MLDQLTKLVRSLSIAQRLGIVGAAAGVFAGIWYLSHWQRERDFQPLFSGLAAEDAGAVLARLKESGVEYRVGDGGSVVLVPSAKVAELRLQLAASGLPKTGRIGYELFDRTNFGATEFAEQVNYHRAVEGELERSLATIAEVEQARVHITFPKESVFLESRQPAKASVMLKLKQGRKLLPQNIVAITHLAASAVEGLAPEDVSVLDMRGTLLSRPHRPTSPDGVESSDAAIEYRQRLERDLLAKINSTLEPLVGADRFRAGVSVDCDFSSGEQSEETFDPSKSVMTSAQRTEDSSTQFAPAGVPGTPSALPRPVPRPAGSGGGVNRRTENITYQSSRVVKKTKLPQGSIRRLSLSVLLDQRVRWEGTGAKAKRVIEAVAPEKLKTIHDLVAATAGVVPDRGDQLIVESLPFDATLNAEPPGSTPAPVAPTPAGPPWQNQRVQVMGAAGAIVLVVLALLFAAWRKSRKRPAPTAAAEISAPAGTAEPAQQLASAAPAGTSIEQQIAEQTAEKSRQMAAAMEALKVPMVSTKKSEALAKHLTDESKKDPQAMAHVIRTWLSEAERS